MKDLKRNIRIGLSAVVLIMALGCSSSKVKVLNAWKGEQESVEKFKKKNVLVIARTSNNQARLAFENEIANQMRAMGINATESYSKAPKIYPNKEITEERLNFIKLLMESEGFNAVVLTVVKDKSQTTVTENTGIYFGASYNYYYPSYYGSFYNYYSTPYAYGSYYDSFGGYIPISSNTRMVTDYVLETVMYNLDEPEEQQLVAVVTSKLDDPRDADKAAQQFVAKVMESLKSKK